MAANAGKKTYGLIIPKSGASKKSTLKPNIFGDDSDEEEIPKPGKKFGQTNNARLKTQTQLEIQKAMEDDPSVYEYDSIYDNMQQKKVEKNSALLKGKDKKSRYINNLLKAAEDRKKDDERRKERSVQKERDEEAKEGKFQDKEQYVTTAYKQKLLEMEKEAEEERRKAALEEAMDVTKQKDLSGFYRHFLNQQTGEEEIPDNTRVKQEKEVKTEPADTTTDTKPLETRVKEEFPDDRDDTRSTSNESDSSSTSSRATPQRPIKEEGDKVKSYRKREGSETEKTSREYRSSSPKRQTTRSRSRSRDKKKRSRSPRTSRSKKSRSRERSKSRERSRSPQKSRHRRSRSRSRERSRKKHDRHSRRSRSGERRSRSPHHRSRDSKSGKSGRDESKSKKRDRDSHTPHDDRKGERGKIDEGESKKVKTDSKNNQKTEKDTDDKKPEKSLAERFAKRNVGTAVEDARARYMARKKQKTAVIEAEEN